MVNYGNGYTWQDVYHMPIHWRKFYFDLLLKSKKKEKTEIDKINNQGKTTGPSLRVRK